MGEIGGWWGGAVTVGEETPEVRIVHEEDFEEVEGEVAEGEGGEFGEEEGTTGRVAVDTGGGGGWRGSGRVVEGGEYGGGWERDGRDEKVPA